MAKCSECGRQRGTNYRLDYTLRIDGLERQSCHYSLDLIGINAALEVLEQELGAWGFSIHDVSAAEAKQHFEWITRPVGG